MIRTQIQLPEALYRDAKALAERKEWSLAEVVRRALEQLLCLFPETTVKNDEWELPPGRDLGSDAFFDNPDWRYNLNQARGVVRETAPPYRAKRKGKRA